ncbi:protein of unknown function [Thermococcus nautili]|nr:protein of unknown function [Thermococcus nautili]
MPPFGLVGANLAFGTIWNDENPCGSVWEAKEQTKSPEFLRNRLFTLNFVKKA